MLLGESDLGDRREHFKVDVEPIYISLERELDDYISDYLMLDCERIVGLHKLSERRWHITVLEGFDKECLSQLDKYNLTFDIEYNFEWKEPLSYKLKLYEKLKKEIEIEESRPPAPLMPFKVR